MKIFNSFLVYCFIITIISCGKSTEENLNETVAKTNDTIFGSNDDVGTTEDISISNSASANSTVAFGQSYQHQLTTTGP